MKRVLFLIPDLSHGGAEKVLVNLANNLDKSKYEVSIKTLFDKGVNRQYIGDDVRYIPGLRWQFRGNSHLIRRVPAKLLYRCFVKEKYDIIVSYLEGSTARVLSGCTDPSTKRVAWIHIELGSEKKIASGFKNSRLAVEAYKKFDKVVFVSRTVKEAFEKTADDALNNGVVLYNTVESSLILKKSQECIDDLILSDDVNICSVAKIINTKGYDRLVRVHKRLLDEGLKHHIYILGVGEQQEELERYLHKYGLEDSFTFVGFRDNPYKYVAACDLYVCSSRREGFSTAVTESLIVGTPVVSTCCSGAHELLGENNEYGIVTENSEDGIYSGLKRMLEDPELLEYYRNKAIERGKEFSTAKTVCEVEKMLESI